MKNIIVTHTNYQIFGGEDSNFLEEVGVLSEKFSVSKLQFSNKDKINFSDLIGFISNSNFKSNNEFKKILKETNSAIFYIHNLWFKGNLQLLKIAVKQRLEIIIKIHNFRYFCASSYFSENHVKKNQVCNACGYTGTGRFKFNKYFSSSYLKSFFVIWHTKKMIKLLKKYHVKILLISNQHFEFISKQIPNNKRLYKVYNPITIPKNTKKYNENSKYVVYAGRVTKEKGIFELIYNWNQFNKKNIELRILGEVDSKLTEYLYNFKEEIKIYGHLDLDKTLEHISNARSLILPTLLYEGQPRVLCEASALGVPSIFPNFGSLKEIFPNEYLLKYEQFNSTDFLSKLNLLHNEQVMRASSDIVFKFSKENFAKEVILEKFIDVVND